MVMAYIYTMVGEFDRAFDEFDYALSISSYCTVEFLEADPLMDELRKQPRFKELKVKYGQK